MDTALTLTQQQQKSLEALLIDAFASVTLQSADVEPLGLAPFWLRLQTLIGPELSNVCHSFLPSDLEEDPFQQRFLWHLRLLSTLTGGFLPASPSSVPPDSRFLHDEPETSDDDGLLDVLDRFRRAWADEPSIPEDRASVFVAAVRISRHKPGSSLVESLISDNFFFLDLGYPALVLHWAQKFPQRWVSEIMAINFSMIPTPLVESTVRALIESKSLCDEDKEAVCFRVWDIDGLDKQLPMLVLTRHGLKPTQKPSLSVPIITGMIRAELWGVLDKLWPPWNHRGAYGPLRADEFLNVDWAAECPSHVPEWTQEPVTLQFF